MNFEVGDVLIRYWGDTESDISIVLLVRSLDIDVMLVDTHGTYGLDFRIEDIVEELECGRIEKF